MIVKDLIAQLNTYAENQKVFISIRQEDGSQGCTEVGTTANVLVRDETMSEDDEPETCVLLF